MKSKPKSKPQESINTTPEQKSSPYLLMEAAYYDQYKREKRQGLGTIDVDGDLLWASLDDVDVFVGTRFVSAQIPENIPPQRAARQLFKMAAWLLTQPTLTDSEEYGHTYRKFFAA